MRRLFEDNTLQLRPLRPRQAAAIEAIRKAVREGHRRIVLQAPTGFGKTLTAAHIIASAVARGKRPMFTCPAITLVEQTLKAFEAEGINDIGVIQAQHERTDFDAQVQIASVQTLIRRQLPEIDLVLIDEVHNKWDKFQERLDSEEFKDKVVIGLSATPWSKGMGLEWTKLIVAATIEELIAEKLLCHFIIQCPPDRYEPDMSKVKTVKGDFEEAGSARVMSAKTLVANVVDTWLEKGTEDRTFLFAVNRAHAQALRDEFEQRGVRCGYIDAYTEDREEKVFKPFRNREFKIIASVGCLTTGVDEDVRCIIDAAPTKSEILHVQKIGRGLRMPHDGSPKTLLILDHAGNTLRLAQVTDIHHDHLDMRDPRAKGDAYSDEKPSHKPKKCRNCNMVIAPGKRSCPFCFHKIEEDHGVQTEPGELVLFEGAAKKKEKPLKIHELNQQDWYSGFLAIAEERGHSTKWADHRFKEKFGEFPMRLRKEPKKPSVAVVAFDHHCRIKWAKGKALASQ